MIDCLIPHLNEASLSDAVLSAAQCFDVVILLDGRSGVQVTRNQLLQLSNAEYVSYLDADDIRYSIRPQLNCLMNNADADCCYAPNQYGCVSPDPIKAIITSRMNPSALWKRESLLKIGDRFGEVWPTNYEACTDAVLYLRALQCGLKLVYCNEPAIYYRPCGRITSDRQRWKQYKLKLLNEVEAWLGESNNQSYSDLIANERLITYALHR